MVASVAATGSTGTLTSPGASLAGLEAQLQRYQKQLSECVNCASAKTPEGKAQIDKISQQIHGVKQRIDQVNQTPKTADSTAPRQPTTPTPNPAIPRNLATTGLGQRINDYA